jgi:hypothetical protein
MQESVSTLISSSRKPRRDNRLIELCSLSRRHFAEMASASCVGRGERADDLAAAHQWYEAVEVISRTQALTYAGIKAKTRVCYDVITKLNTHNDTESHLMRSLFRDILGA